MFHVKHTRVDLYHIGEWLSNTSIEPFCYYRHQRIIQCLGLVHNLLLSSLINYLYDHSCLYKYKAEQHSMNIEKREHENQHCVLAQ